MGFYENPYDNFGRLQNELWRAVRLVLDTGIHAKRWTREQAIDYFRETTPLSEGDIVTEVERFFVKEAAFYEILRKEQPEDPLGRGEVKTWYVELTAIVRRYIERTKSGA